MIQGPGFQFSDTSDSQPGGPFQRHILATIHDRWLDTATVDLAERRLCGWATAEMLRVSGSLQLTSTAPNQASLAESSYRASIKIAQEQRALAWELRASTSLGVLLRSQGRNAIAAKSLRAVYDKFTEGFESADLLKAQSLLEDIESKRPLDPLKID
jgi:predicted ATPase